MLEVHDAEVSCLDEDVLFVGAEEDVWLGAEACGVGEEVVGGGFGGTGVDVEEGGTSGAGWVAVVMRRTRC